VKTILRLVLWLLMGGVALAGILAALAGYFLYTPNPELPRLSGTVTGGNCHQRAKANVPGLYTQRTSARSAAGSSHAWIG